MIQKFNIFPKQQSPELVKAREVKNKAWDKMMYTNPWAPEYPEIRAQFLNALHYFESLVSREKAKEKRNGH